MSEEKNEKLEALKEAMNRCAAAKLEAATQETLARQLAIELGLSELETDKARLETVTKEAAIGRIPGWTEPERVAALKENGCEAYITETCDTKLLKKDFSRSAAKREKLKEFGFQLRAASKSIVVKAL